MDFYVLSEKVHSHNELLWANFQIVDIEYHSNKISNVFKSNHYGRLQLLGNNIRAKPGWVISSLHALEHVYCNYGVRIFPTDPFHTLKYIFPSSTNIFHSDPSTK